MFRQLLLALLTGLLMALGALIAVGLVLWRGDLGAQRSPDAPPSSCLSLGDHPALPTVLAIRSRHRELAIWSGGAA